MANVEQIVDRLAKEDPLYGIYRPGLGSSRTQMIQAVAAEAKADEVSDSKLPNRKVGSAALAGALSTVLVFLAGKYGVELDAEAGSAITLLLTALTGYIVPEKESE